MSERQGAIAAVAALVVSIASGCGSPATERGFDPRAILERGAAGDRPDESRSLAAAFRSSPCLAAELAGREPEGTEPEDEFSGDDVRRLAELFCGAGDPAGLELSADPFGQVVVTSASEFVEADRFLAAFAERPEHTFQLPSSESATGGKACGRVYHNEPFVLFVPEIAFELSVPPQADGALVAIDSYGVVHCPQLITAGGARTVFQGLDGPLRLHWATTSGSGESPAVSLSPATESETVDTLTVRDGERYLFDAYVGPFVDPGSRFGDPSCGGRTQDEPTVTLHVDFSGELHIELSQSTADPLLFVARDGSLVGCNDDSNELESALNLTVSPGTYEVFVGAYDDTATELKTTIAIVAQ